MVIWHTPQTGTSELKNSDSCDAINRHFHLACHQPSQLLRAPVTQCSSSCWKGKIEGCPNHRFYFLRRTLIKAQATTREFLHCGRYSNQLSFAWYWMQAVPQWHQIMPENSKTSRFCTREYHLNSQLCWCEWPDIKNSELVTVYSMRCYNCSVFIILQCIHSFCSRMQA